MVWCDVLYIKSQKARRRYASIRAHADTKKNKALYMGLHTLHTHAELHHPPAGRKMSFLSIDDSIFSPMVQHSHSRPLTKGPNLKKRIVSES